MMSTLDPGFRFNSRIWPTFKNTKAVINLTYQDVMAGGFKNPLNLADPSNLRKFIKQWLRLIRHPERYCCFTQNGEVVAFMKQNVWTAADEAPYGGTFSGEWGIFALVAADKLTASDREEVLSRLLRSSFIDLRTHKQRAVNIPIHGNDPLLQIALRLGFVPTGKVAEAAGAPGLEQQRYRRPASY